MAWVRNCRFVPNNISPWNIYLITFFKFQKFFDEMSRNYAMSEVVKESMLSCKLHRWNTARLSEFHPIWSQQKESYYWPIYFAIVIILSFISWASLARIIRGMCLSLREREYVLAARAIGLSDFKIIVTHILPHTLSYSIFALMLSIPGYILGESALSLIGLGIQDPYASWGNLLSDAMSIVRITFAPWILWPAFFIFLTVMCFNVIGDALRDCLDPLLKTEGKT